jgi:hypothetical protein
LLILNYNKLGQLQRNRLDKSCSTNKITRSKQLIQKGIKLVILN